MARSIGDMARFRVRIFAVLTTGFVLAACGGAEKPAMAPGASDSTGGPQTESVESSPAAAPNDVPEAATPTAAGATPDNGGAKKEAALRNARGDLQHAMRELDASLGDCTNACRALLSLEHATAHLCELASDAGDQGTCSDAKARVVKARSQIKASCGTCSNGASLDAASPIR